MMAAIEENKRIAALARDLPRSEHQLNGLQESDAELIRLPGSSSILAVTTDSIVEEIETGLYRDPFLIGWMTVMVNASDLAAVGADPIGILLNETLPARVEESFLAKMQEGIAAACSLCRLPVLGGDTNISSRLQMGGCAIGQIDRGAPLTRLGARPGQLVMTSGPLGGGNAFAAAQFGMTGAEIAYRPRARLAEGRLLRDLARCCIDTSDGALAACAQLVSVNGCGFALDRPWVDALHPQALDLARTLSLPPWLFLAGPHGEFELLFTIGPADEETLLARAPALHWHPKVIGRVIQTPQVTLDLGRGAVSIDAGRVCNLPGESGGHIERIVQALLEMNASLTAGDDWLC